MAGQGGWHTVVEGRGRHCSMTWLSPEPAEPASRTLRHSRALPRAPCLLFPPALTCGWSTLAGRSLRELGPMGPKPDKYINKAVDLVRRPALRPRLSRASSPSWRAARSMSTTNGLKGGSCSPDSCAHDPKGQPKGHTQKAEGTHALRRRDTFCAEGTLTFSLLLFSLNVP